LIKFKAIFLQKNVDVWLNQSIESANLIIRRI